MTYTLAACIGVIGALALDLAIVQTRLVQRRAFWTAYAIVLFFQLVVNGLLTGLDIVRYDRDAIVGWRIAYAPVEDLLFGYAMVLMTLSLWVWHGRRAARPMNPEAPPRRPSPDARG